MPALGCGLGGLKWEVVGPLMCKYFSKMKGLSTSIYLPAEKQIEDKFLTSDHLLSDIDF